MKKFKKKRVEFVLYTVLAEELEPPPPKKNMFIRLKVYFYSNFSAEKSRIDVQ